MKIEKEGQNCAQWKLGCRQILQILSEKQKISKKKRLLFSEGRERGPRGVTGAEELWELSNGRKRRWEIDWWKKRMNGQNGSSSRFCELPMHYDYRAKARLIHQIMATALCATMHIWDCGLGREEGGKGTHVLERRRPRAQPVGLQSFFGGEGTTAHHESEGKIADGDEKGVVCSIKKEETKKNLSFLIRSERNLIVSSSYILHPEVAMNQSVHMTN